MEMEGIAFSDSELPDLLPPDLSECDRCHWLVATPAGWSPMEGTHCETWEALEALLGTALIETPALAEHGWSLVKAGMFSKVVPYLQLDEWTYLIGFRPLAGSPDEAVNDPDLIAPLGPGFFESLSKHQATALCYIAGWWECFPATSTLLVHAGPNLRRAPTQSEKWLRFAMDPATPLYPDPGA
jgi:hypothetical protein